MKVEVGDYRSIEKGALKGAFSLALSCSEGQGDYVQIISDCKFFSMGDKTWWSLPSKEIKKDGMKTMYIPMVKFNGEKFSEWIKKHVLEQLLATGVESNGVSQAPKITDPNQHKIPSEPSSVWF